MLSINVTDSIESLPNKDTHFLIFLMFLEEEGVEYINSIEGFVNKTPFEGMEVATSLLQGDYYIDDINAVIFINGVSYNTNSWLHHNTGGDSLWEKTP